MNTPLQLDHPALVMWRAQPANRRLTDSDIEKAIEAGNEYARLHSTVTMT